MGVMHHGPWQDHGKPPDMASTRDTIMNDGPDY
jgi:hypothetical protein